ncbi:MAG TPA: alpha/beta fold hydrolase [Longimicrobiales bacterium]
MSIHRLPVLIPAEGALLAGRIHRNTDDLLEPQPGVVVSGSWLTVKEQMADLYAAQLAALGYTVLTFDFRGFGGSEGTPRQTEMPLGKIADIVAATRFLRSLACVRGDRVGYLAVCASAMYAAAAVEAGAPIGALASVAGWFHDTESVAPFYGGAAGVAARLERARQAHDRYLATGELSLVPAYEEGNERAGMFIPMDYYANPTRGRIPEWRNEMSELTWLYWLTFDGLAAAERLDVPALFVHGDECVFPDHVRRIHERIRAPKRMVWQPGFQVDFYDRPDLVGVAVEAAHEHFSEFLSA